MGLKLIKFHTILHLVDDILNFGVPNNVDTGPNESHHKITKVAAKMTQRDITKFKHQTGKRLVEFLLIDLAVRELEGKQMWEYFATDQERGPIDDPKIADDDDEDDQQSTGRTAIKVFFGVDEGEPSWKL